MSVLTYPRKCYFNYERKSEFRTCGNKRFACFIGSVFTEVLNEAAGKVFRLLIPYGGIGIGVARVEDCGIYTRQLCRHIKIEH